MSGSVGHCHSQTLNRPERLWRAAEPGAGYRTGVNDAREHDLDIANYLLETRHRVDPASDAYGKSKGTCKMFLVHDTKDMCQRGHNGTDQRAILTSPVTSLPNGRFNDDFSEQHGRYAKRDR